MSDLIYLARAVVALEDLAGVVNAGSRTDPGYYRRMALALETLTTTSSAGSYLSRAATAFEVLAGATSVATATEAGYFLRSAIAAELASGTDTPANATPAGYLKKIALACENGFGPRIIFTGSIAEGATTGRAVGTATLTNPPLDIGTLTWSELGTGTGAALFAIDGSTGAVTNSAALDYETATSYTYGIQVTDGVYTYTLLAPISVTDVAGDPNLDTALIAPGFTLVSAQDAYPPEFDITIDASLDVEVLSIRLQGGDEDFSTLAVDQEIDPIGSGALDFTDLADVTTGEHFFRCRIENGTMYGPWSLVRKHGDTTAPTITSSASASAVEGVVNPTGTATADETVAWEISGGADAGLVTIDADTGEWVINETTDYDFGQNTYVFDISCTDLAGNVSTPQTFTYTVTNNAADDPDPAWSTIRKDAAITLSNSNFTASCAYAAGVMPVECNTARSAAATSKFYCTLNFHVDGNSGYFGFHYTDAALGAFNLGYFRIGPWGWELHDDTGALIDMAYPGYSSGIVVSVERAGLTMTIKVDGVTVVSSYTLPGGSGDLVGIFGGTNMYSCTADFTDY